MVRVFQEDVYSENLLQLLGLPHNEAPSYFNIMLHGFEHFHHIMLRVHKFTAVPEVFACVDSIVTCRLLAPSYYT